MSMLRDNNLNCSKEKSRMVSGIFCLETFAFLISNRMFNPLIINRILGFCCFQWNKDTKMKANHNVCLPIYIYDELFPMEQRY